MLSHRHSFALITTLYLSLTACGSDTNHNHAKVYKYDGSVQCNQESAIPLDEMRLELAKQGIDVICAQKASDGLNYTTVCESGTGNINVYTIHKSNLPDAEKLGFKSVTELSEYQDNACHN